MKSNFTKNRRRKDANHGAIHAALIAAGFDCEDVHNVGNGFPDEAVYLGHGVTLLYEVKTETGELTPAEVKWHEKHPGAAVIIRTPEQAIEYAQSWAHIMAGEGGMI